MLLNEFFGGHVENSNDLVGGDKSVKEAELVDKVYWYMLDDDDLHKDVVVPLAREIASKLKDNKFDSNEYTLKWMPLVNQACIKYYKENKLKDDIKDVFTKEIRQGLCQRIADRHHKDISSGEYNLGV